MSARLLLLAALLASTLAWATGERIVVSPAASPLREALCVSMSCGAEGRVEASVTTRVLGGNLEVMVARGGGAAKVVAAAPVGEGGRLSSMDLARLVTRAVAAIECRGPAEAVAAASATKRVKVPTVLIARRGMP